MARAKRPGFSHGQTMGLIWLFPGVVILFALSWVTPLENYLPWNWGSEQSPISDLSADAIKERRANLNDRFDVRVVNRVGRSIVVVSARLDDEGRFTGPMTVSALDRNDASVHPVPATEAGGRCMMFDTGMWVLEDFGLAEEFETTLEEASDNLAFTMIGTSPDDYTVRRVIVPGTCIPPGDFTIT